MHLYEYKNQYKSKKKKEIGQEIMNI